MSVGTVKDGIENKKFIKIFDETKFVGEIKNSYAILILFGDKDLRDATFRAEFSALWCQEESCLIIKTRVFSTAGGGYLCYWDPSIREVFFPKINFDTVQRKVSIHNNVAEASRICVSEADKYFDFISKEFDLFNIFRQKNVAEKPEPQQSGSPYRSNNI